MSYTREFGDNYTVPKFLIINPWEDISWHNDAMPSFLNKERGLLVWIAEIDPEDREYECPQYMVCPVIFDETGDYEVQEAVFTCETVQELITYLGE